MKIRFLFAIVFVVFTISFAPVTIADEQSRLKELDAYWAEVSRSVREGDFEGYQATCHPKGVLVSGRTATSYPLTQALAGWKPGFVETKEGKIKADVHFRFGQRFGDKTTAHETGIFHYTKTDQDGKTTSAYIHLEALLIKESKWTIMMEYQKSEATKAEWDKLK